jgi:leader peptidase (prepilin peptidase)/N-methyltransferase
VTWFAEATVASAAASAVVGLVAGFAVPPLIARLPEPVSEEEKVDEADADTLKGLIQPVLGGEPLPDAEPAEPVGQGVGETVAEAVPDVVAAEPKELYSAIAALPGLGWKCALASAVAAGLVGGKIGWEWALLPLVALVPVGVALAVVDWRTRLLPTKIIAPLYAVVVTLCVVASLLSGDWGDLRRAGWGWVLGGGTFLLLWLVYPRGMGYGDVRLSGVLGIALGYLGWGQLVVGVYAGFLLGGVGGTLLTLLRIVDRRAYPFGPFMLLGALAGVLWGGWFAALYTS